MMAKPTVEEQKLRDQIRAEVEAELEQAEKEASAKRHANAGSLQREQKKLNRLEETTEQGVALRTPKQRMIDMAPLNRMFQGYHFRPVHRDKVESRTLDGYELVTEADAKAAGLRGATIGTELVIMKVPVANVEARRKRIHNENRRRMRDGGRGKYVAEVAQEEARLRSAGATIDGSLLVEE